MYNVCLKLSYNGSSYSGSQKQKSTEETIQGKLEEAIKKLFVIDKVRTLFAGRTDAGVHASGQYVNFKIRRLIPPSNVKSGLNSFLPADIRVLEVHKMRKSFHARYMAEGREYLYNIFVGEHMPLCYQGFAWHVPFLKSIEKLQQACECFLGSRDYTAFSITGSDEKTGVRNIYASEISVQDISGEWLGGKVKEEGKGLLLTYRIHANGFLYRMVRRIVASLVAIGNGELEISQLCQIRDSADRSQLRIAAAPAHGLTLNRVIYNKSEEL